MNKQKFHQSEKKRTEDRNGSIVCGSRKIVVVVLAVFLVIMTGIFHYSVNLQFTLGADFRVFLALPAGYLLVKVTLSFFYRPTQEEVLTGVDAFPYTVSAVLPCYNEKAEPVIGAIESLLAQTYPLKEIIFVDDGTPEPEDEDEVTAYDAVLELIEKHEKTNHKTRIIAHKLAVNQGKVHAQSWGIKYATSDLLMTVDSDGTVNPNGLEEMVKVFAHDRKKAKETQDETVGSVVGYVAARNLDEGFVTKVQDMNYSGAFSVGRAAQSVLNSVIVCSGAMSLHRRSIVMAHMDDYVNEKALGIHVNSGDDRRLTRLSKIHGYKTKYQSTAICYTDTPMKQKVFVKQRVRWTRSSWIYSVQNFGVVPLKRLPYLIFSFMESYLWLINLLIWLIFSRKIETSTDFWIHALIYAMLLNYLNSVYYVFHRPFRFLISPIYGLYYFVMLNWIYVRTVLKLFKGNWGTRESNNRKEEVASS